MSETALLGWQRNEIRDHLKFSLIPALDVIEHEWEEAREHGNCSDLEELNIAFNKIAFHASIVCDKLGVERIEDLDIKNDRRPERLALRGNKILSLDTLDDSYNKFWEFPKTPLSSEHTR